MLKIIWNGSQYTLLKDGKVIAAGTMNHSKAAALIKAVQTQNPPPTDQTHNASK